ncbi:uncharacterized protein TNCV_4221881 [Trichonephila clavipes]|nr:uncharacterized protein TNCV_4221881 [Trichonephila clavipes]
MLCSLQNLTNLSSSCRANLDPSVDIASRQSDTVQIIYWRHHLNHAPLDWTGKEKQTRGTRAYSPFKCSFRRTVAADIVLPMAVATINITCVDVDLAWLQQT